MAFYSLSFAIFLTALTVVYFLAPKRARWCVLLAASYAFYAVLGLKALCFLLFTTLSSYLCALVLQKLNDKRGIPAARRSGRWLLAAALCLNFGLLAVFKLHEPLLRLLNSPRGFSLLLPLGMSFYIFQSAGYVTDVYRAKYRAETNPFRFALFISFFPQLTQGPIARFDRLSDSLFAGHGWDSSRVRSALQFILWGLFKKLVIADRAAILVNTVFASQHSYGGSVLFIAVLFYSLQIYCDFSGGIDMARGVALLFGVELDANFRQPFFAVSIADYWRRWHITLGSWLKDYLFFPISISRPAAVLGRFSRKLLGPERGRLVPACAATFIVYLAVGLWHGVSLKYVAFGIYNGIIITGSLFLEPALRKWRLKFGIASHPKLWHLLFVLRTALLVIAGRYFTRSDSLSTALALLWRTLRHPIPGQLSDGTLMSLGLSIADYIVLLTAVAALFIYDGLCERGVPAFERLDRRGFFPQYGVMLAMILSIVFLGIYAGDYIGFIYAQF